MWSAILTIIPFVDAGSLQLKSATCRSSVRTSVAPVRMISNPFGKKPDAPKKPWGDENPYRIFGVNEEAPYEVCAAEFRCFFVLIRTAVVIAKCTSREK